MRKQRLPCHCPTRHHVLQAGSPALSVWPEAQLCELTRASAAVPVLKVLAQEIVGGLDPATAPHPLPSTANNHQKTRRSLSRQENVLASHHSPTPTLSNTTKMSTAELASAYSALILADEGIEITVRSTTTTSLP